MNVLTIILTFVVAYAMFMAATYFLARIFFPLEDTTEKSLKEDQTYQYHSQHAQTNVGARINQDFSKQSYGLI